nr:MAG TPA: hypothetical protein [Bacteriophage sp.]
MKLEGGMYIRTNYGKIDKILKLNESYVKGESQKDEFYAYDIENIVKASYSIIDILEVGDYANGVEITEIYEKGDSFRGNRNYIFKEKIIEVANDNYETIPVEALFTNNGIETIVTKEQFEQMEYRIGE